VTATIQGQDFSHWNCDVNFAAAVKAGQMVFYCKSSEGSEDNGVRDGTYQAKRAACGVLAPFAPYHFLKMTATAKAQAEWFKKCAPEPTSLSPVADIEQHPGEPVNSTIPLSKKRAHVREFLLRTEEAFLRRPIIYTGVYWWKDNVGEVEWAKDYDYIFAAYLFYKQAVPANFVPYWPGPRTLPAGVPRDNVIGWQWAGDIPNNGKYPWASGGQDFNTFDAEAIYALASWKPPLSDAEKLARLWAAHAGLH
jgi:GH25 family lysozyme M1 (1,4-beta-N-acetylmuramidase)